MRRYTYTLLAVLALAGCDKIIEREYHQERTERRTIFCTYACFTCGLDWDGKLSCGINSCGGTQPADVRVRPYTAWWQSERVTEEEETTVLETFGSCG